ncbi:MAG: VCBS repeat-containing protein [Chloroflexi bacterium]|nr:VCBS repeat-containing protein [Chloroflexota bacterium]
MTSRPLRLATLAAFVVALCLVLAAAPDPASARLKPFVPARAIPASATLPAPNAATALPGVDHSAAVWGDYDNDGERDILLAGCTDSGSIAGIYRNDGGAFTDIGAGLPGACDGSAAWGDYDNDGDLDFALAGSDAGRFSAIYRNDGGTFTDIQAGLPGTTTGAVEWGDYDNDGDLDIVLTGAGHGYSDNARVYRNDGGGAFTEIVGGLTAVQESSTAWGDYDNDADLDLLLTGINYSGVLPVLVASVYSNNSTTPNTAPSAPSGLAVAAISGDTVTLTTCALAPPPAQATCWPLPPTPSPASAACPPPATPDRAYLPPSTFTTPSPAQPTTGAYRP